MKYFPLIWMGLWQKRTRTVLTLLSIIVAFVLFGLLQGVDSLIRGTRSDANLKKLNVDSDATMMSGRFTTYQMLPISYLDEIKSIPGISNVGHHTMFPAYHGDPKNIVFAVATNVDQMGMNSHIFDMPQEKWDELRRTRRGIAIGEAVAKKQGWKIGDRITLTSLNWPHPDGTSNWEFDVVGIIRSEKMPGMSYFNYDYFDEGREPSWRGLITRFDVQVDDPSQVDSVAKAIDERFKNSDRPTTSQSEMAQMQFVMKSIGDIGFIVHSVLGAVFATLLFLTINTMMQSVRERIPQIAVLKTLGFSDGAVLSMVLAECASICLFGGLLGVLFAAVAFPLMKKIVGVAQMPPMVIVWGLLAALATAVLAGALPAWRAKRLKIVDALAGR